MHAGQKKVSKEIDARLAKEIARSDKSKQKEGKPPPSITDIGKIIDENPGFLYDLFTRQQVENLMRLAIEWRIKQTTKNFYHDPHHPTNPTGAR